MITVSHAADPQAWDTFLKAQRFSPFLQSWTMGEVYRDIGQEPFRFVMQEGKDITGICFAHVVPARRGRHLAVPYGPVLSRLDDLPLFLDALKKHARKRRCSFIRMSPFWSERATLYTDAHPMRPAPMHLLGEHVWYLPLKNPDPWRQKNGISTLVGRTEEELLAGMRKTTRNLIRRAEKEGVTIECPKDPLKDIDQFIALHEETRKRHHFTPYSTDFFRAQVKHFAPRGEALLYLARYQGQTIAASIHMQFGGETSYHHGASSFAFSKIPASYLLQWTAIKDALQRGDDIYSFWGIAPMRVQETETPEDPKLEILHPNHPFAGVTLFKTGFGGNLLNLVHCMDFPLSQSYHFTRAFEKFRKWKRGF